MSGSIHRLIGVVVAASMSVLVGCGGDETAAPRRAEPVFSLPRTSAGAITLLGEDASGAAVAISVDGDVAAAYRCDGEGTGVWFTGEYDATTGRATLESAGGDSMVVEVWVDSTATLTGDGASTFDLEPAERGAGLFRDTYVVDGETRTAGWIVGNDGTVVGNETGSGGTTESSATATAGRRTPFGCGILGMRINFNLARGDREQARELLQQFTAGCTVSSGPVAT